MNKHLAALTLLALTTALPRLGFADPVGDAFTYQGRLLDNGQPANDLYDFSFFLHDAATGGTLALDPVSLDDVPVEDGVFTVSLDFGGGLFTGERRWLEIRVKGNQPGDSYETLVGRQEITPTPYALYALSGNPGPAGPQGTSGVLAVASFAGTISTIPAGGGNAPWVFAGPTATVTVAAGQRLTGSAVGSIQHLSTTLAVPVGVNLCLLNTDAPAGTAPESFHTNTYPDVTVPVKADNSQFLHQVSSAASRVVSSAGSYRVGLCLKNKSPSVALPANDYVNGWVIVSN